MNNTNSGGKIGDIGGGGHARSLERDSGISDHGLEDENEAAGYAEGEEREDDYDDIDCQEFENKLGLSQDLRFLFGMPELCDVMFVVGEERQAMYGVKAVLAIRSRVFYKMLYGPRSKSKLANSGDIVILGSGSVNGGSSSNNSSAVGQFGRKLLGRNGPENTNGGHDHHRRNFSFLRHPQASRRAAANSNGWQGSAAQSQKTIVQVDDFDPDVFKQLLEYVHTGAVVLRPRTLLGLLNAADHFALEELRRACADYSQKCINLDTVCSLLVTAERYIQYKSSKIFVQRVLDFVDKNGDDVLQLSDFVHLPRHVVELILSRDELNATEMNKFQAALRWSRHYVLYHSEYALQQAMAPFTQYVAFHSMSAQQLMHEIRPLDVVPDRILMNALAYQADPNSIVDSEEGGALTSSRFNPGSACRPKEQQQQPKTPNFKQKINHQRTMGRPRQQQQYNRSKSVDRNLSKISKNSSSNCSDSGFHDDYNSTYYSNQGDESGREKYSDQTDRRIRSIDRNASSTPGATVVRVESSPSESIEASINQRNESGSSSCSTNSSSKAKSCHDITLITNLTSVHYRF